MNIFIRFTMVAALIVSAFAATPAAASYQTPINLDNTGPGNTTQTQVLAQIDTASLRAGGVIASDSCADVAFYDGATRLNHWFETTCPGPAGGGQRLA